MRLFLKVFLLTAFAFAFFMTLMEGLSGYWPSPGSFLLRSILFGLTMGVVLVSLHILRLKKLGVARFTKESLSVRQQIRVRSELNKEAIRTLLVQDPWFGKMRLKLQANKITLFSNLSFWSWGEVIRVGFPEGNTEAGWIEISSRPQWPLTLVDFGRNRQHILRLEELLTGKQ